MDGGRLSDIAEELYFAQRDENERRGIIGPPTNRARRHKIVVELTDPKKARAINLCHIYMKKVRHFTRMYDFLDHATEADLQHIESLLGIDSNSEDMT